MPRGTHLSTAEKSTIIAERALGKAYRAIGCKVDRSITAIHNTLKTDKNERNSLGAIRERVIQALNERGLDDIGYAEKCIQLLNCKKHQLQPDGSLDLVPDNQTQAKVLNTVKDIMGLDAVKQSEVKHTIELTPSENDEIMIIRRKHNIVNVL